MPTRARASARPSPSYALDDARARGLAVIPYCPFINEWLKRHPSYTDLVPADERERFGL